jgi:3-hydroxyisobutyrate dehydrogenase-like beta-hydroxyacid dehydrogenase
METVGVIGRGKIGLRIADNLIKSEYRVVGCRRHAMTEFARLGGKPADSPADVGAAADIVFSCLSSAQALDEVFQGPHGLVHSARPGQILVELGSTHSRRAPP